jgi:hypothetical protein
MTLNNPKPYYAERNEEIFNKEELDNAERKFEIPETQKLDYAERMDLRVKRYFIYK